MKLSGRESIQERMELQAEKAGSMQTDTLGYREYGLWAGTKVAKWGGL